jgi:hypothetical protein
MTGRFFKKQLRGCIAPEDVRANFILIFLIFQNVSNVHLKNKEILPLHVYILDFNFCSSRLQKRREPDREGTKPFFSSAEPQQQQEAAELLGHGSGRLTIAHPPPTSAARHP